MILTLIRFQQGAGRKIVDNKIFLPHNYVSAEKHLMRIWPLKKGVTYQVYVMKSVRDGQFVFNRNKFEYKGLYFGMEFHEYNKILCAINCA